MARHKRQGERESEKREGEREKKNQEYKGLSVNVSSSEWVWIGVIRVFHFIAWPPVPPQIMNPIHYPSPSGVPAFIILLNLYSEAGSWESDQRSETADQPPITQSQYLKGSKELFNARRR